MTKFARALGLAVAAGLAITAVAAAEKPEPVQKDKEAPRGEVLKTVISATAEFDKDKKKLTINAVGQVPTGGWSGAKLTRKETKTPPKDGIYEYELTAIRPTGIVTQALSKVNATAEWENPPADLKVVKILGAGEGANTVKVEK
jgi:hypothetical protein